jgi:hypothetical protein
VGVGHNCLCWPIVVLIDDCVCMVASNGAYVVREIKQLVNLAHCELGRGDFKRGEAVS